MVKESDKVIEVGDQVRVKENYSFAYPEFSGIVRSIDPSQGLPYGVELISRTGATVLKYFYREELSKRVVLDDGRCVYYG